LALIRECPLRFEPRHVRMPTLRRHTDIVRRHFHTANKAEHRFRARPKGGTNILGHTALAWSPFHLQAYADERKCLRITGTGQVSEQS
jgi:hypothetical protein